jgi:hypothetical protein
MTGQTVVQRIGTTPRLAHAAQGVRDSREHPNVAGDGPGQAMRAVSGDARRDHVKRTAPTLGDRP